MKCCCNRNNFGITIGSLYIAGSIIVMIFQTIVYTQFSEHIEDPEHREDLKNETIERIIICLVTVVLAALYIVAIVKKYEYLLLPFMIFGIYVFYVSCGFMFWWFIGAGIGGASGITFFILLLIAVLLFVGQIGIFCFSISLFRQILRENAENKSESAQVDHQLAGKSLI